MKLWQRTLHTLARENHLPHEHLGMHRSMLCPPAAAELGHEGLGENVPGAPPEAVPAPSDNLLVVFIMVAIFLVLCSYVMK